MRFPLFRSRDAGTSCATPPSPIIKTTMAIIISSRLKPAASRQFVVAGVLFICARCCASSTRLLPNATRGSRPHVDHAGGQKHDRAIPEIRIRGVSQIQHIDVPAVAGGYGPAGVESDDAVGAGKRGQREA